MAYWLHRISHHSDVSYPLLFDHGLLSIGFSDFSDENFMQSPRASIADFDRLFDQYWNTRPRSRYILRKFVSGMKAGDRVVVPSSGVFHVFEVLEDEPLIAKQAYIPGFKNSAGTAIELGEDGKWYYAPLTDKCLVELGFFRKVKLIAKDIRRNEFADNALVKRMKARDTTYDISDLENSVKEAVMAFQNNQPINAHELVVNESWEAVANIIKTKLDWRKFEKLVGWYLERAGATSIDTPSKNEGYKEGDADVMAFFEPIKTVIYVQVKHHEGETDEWAITQIADYVGLNEEDDGYTKISWVISSADRFSPSSVESAKQHGIRLINIEEFVKMILDAGLASLDNAFH